MSKSKKNKNKKKKVDPDIENINLTMAKKTLQWWINKDKNDPDVDYSQRIQFARFKVERISGQNVKLRK